MPTFSHLSRVSFLLLPLLLHIDALDSALTTFSFFLFFSASLNTTLLLYYSTTLLSALFTVLPQYVPTVRPCYTAAPESETKEISRRPAPIGRERGKRERHQRHQNTPKQKEPSRPISRPVLFVPVNRSFLFQSLVLALSSSFLLSFSFFCSRLLCSCLLCLSPLLSLHCRHSTFQTLLAFVNTFVITVLLILSCPAAQSTQLLSLSLYLYHSLLTCTSTYPLTPPSLHRNSTSKAPAATAPVLKLNLSSLAV